MGILTGKNAEQALVSNPHNGSYEVCLGSRHLVSRQLVPVSHHLHHQLQIGNLQNRNIEWPGIFKGLNDDKWLL